MARADVVDSYGAGRSRPPVLNSGQRLAMIGKRAAELCYAAHCPADNICVGSCAAVCPPDEFLAAASREVFAKYWASHPGHAPNTPDLSTPLPSGSIER